MKFKKTKTMATQERADGTKKTRKAAKPNQMK